MSPWIRTSESESAILAGWVATVILMMVSPLFFSGQVLLYQLFLHYHLEATYTSNGTICGDVFAPVA
jgi:hypothetical protein